ECLGAFPGPRSLRTVVEPAALPAELRQAEPSFLQRLPGATRHHEWLLPLMPLSWRLREPIAGVDAVVSSSHARATAVRAARRPPAPRLRQGRWGPRGRPPRLLLPYADALRVGLRFRGRPVPCADPPRGARRHDVVPPLGPRDGWRRRPRRGQLDRRSRPDPQVLRARGR